MNVDVNRHNLVYDIHISSIVAIEEKFIVVPVVVVCKYTFYTYEIINIEGRGKW